MTSVDVTPDPSVVSATSESIPVSRERAELAIVVRELLLHLVILVLVLVLWQAASVNGWVSERLLPRPTDIASALTDVTGSGLLWPHLGTTMYEAVVGFAIGCVSAFLLAGMAALSGMLRRLLYPYIVAFQVMPRIVIAPMLFIWLGFGTSPKVVLTATICFFPVFVNTMTGLLSVDDDMLDLFRSLRASALQVFLRLRLPNALPMIFAGLKTAVSFALVGAVVGEFISAEEGLGLLTQRFSFQLQMDYAFAIFIVLMFAGLGLYLCVEVADRQIVYWQHDGRLIRRTARKRQRLKAGPR